ncbi:MAG: ATP-binding protein [Actinomycetota bacterium]|nr:ATP-binding protein [Actinomycetota bacterium]
MAGAAAAVAMAIGGIALLGWVLGIDVLKSGLPGLVTMKANTALCFMLAGLSAWLLRGEPAPIAARAGRALALLVAILGVLVGSQYVHGHDLGIDLLLFYEPPGAVGTFGPGRMAPNTAAAFVLVGLALLSLDARLWRRLWPPPLLAFVVALLSLLSLLAYGSGIRSFYGVSNLSQMAVPAAVGFLLLCVAIFFARPERPAVRLVMSDGAGGKLVRGMLPAAVVGPPVLGGLRLLGEKAGLYSTSFGVWLFATSLVALLVPLVWRVGRSLEEADMERRRAEIARREREEALRQARDELETRVEERTAELSETNVTLEREVEERRAAERALEFEREFLSAVLENLEDGVIACDAEGAITLFNRAAREFHALTEERIAVEDWLIHHDRYLADGSTPMGKHEVPLARAFRGEHLRDLKYIVAPKGGLRRTLVASGHPIVGPDGDRLGAVVALHDVTDRERSREQREELERRLQQSQRLESVGQLAGGIAHDFNNLLAVIMNYAQFVADEVKDNEAVHHDVEEIRRAAERAAGLTRQLLIFSRREVVKPELVDVNAVVEGTEKLLRRTLGEHVNLITHLAPQPQTVMADPGQLEQVLVNLAVNARDAMPAGGTLAIETTIVEIDAYQAGRREGLEPGPHVRLTVSDTGHGMAPEVAERVFEPFFSTKPRGAGTGLGLATVYGIARQAGGDVHLYSEPDLGTTFQILLPAAAAASSSSPDLAAEPSAGGGEETILLVEDERSVRELAVRILSRQGYVVLPAEGPDEALAVLERCESHVDLLLTDVVMPGGSGRRLAERIRAGGIEIPVLYMSGYTHDFVGRQDLVDEGVALIEKPFTAESLLRAVREVLEAGARPPERERG